ncbi:hypothetical protein Fot_06094 [Forsythia ovata]|uniref:Uncharacterized protein n=1 Tax=Forsythia ovata TaxID=205694 RepID=A0ABD1WSK8_9LAMI
MGHIMKVLEGWHVEISTTMLNMLPDSASKAAAVVNSYRTERWVRYSDQNSASLKHSEAKAMAARSLMLIEEAETEVCDMESKKKISETALRNADKIISNRDCFWDYSMGPYSN